MNANDLILWLVVAAVAFLVGQSRIARLPQPLLDPISQDTFDQWRRNDGSLVRVYRRGIHDRLVRHYNMEELRGLAFDVGLDHECIKGDTLDEYARELLAFCERRGFLANLLDTVR
ncbi:MAG: hypothetical protein MUC51_14045 [Anaerolineae bacterium]|jgi:hypothetical protein|nr:hypothetical protein [Anaerolineae bacterium]